MTDNQAKKLYQTGIELLTYGKPNEAINYFREAVEANPLCAEAHLELGYIFGVMENYKESLKHFEMVLKIYDFGPSKSEISNARKIENTFPALFCTGMCHFFMENYEKSLIAFREAQFIGENEDMWYYLGNLHLIHTGNIEEAIECFGNAISMDDEFIEAWNDLGVAYSIFEDDKNALLCFEECLSIDRGYKEAIYNMGTTLADMERYEESLKYLNQILESEPDNFKALFYKGNVLYFMEKEEKAIEYFQKALEVDKNQEELWNYLGYIQFSIGQNYEAIESLNEAIKLNEEFDEALEISDFGVSKTEGFAEAYMNLGKVYLALGKNNLAINNFKRALEISPDNEECLTEIESLSVN